MVNPIDYSGAFRIDPVQGFFQGLQQGRIQAEGLQNLSMNAAREARAQQLHPLSMEAAQTGIQAQQAGIAATQAGTEGQRVMTQQRQQQMAQQQQDRQRQEGFRKAWGQVAALGDAMTYDDVAKVVAEYPEYGDSVMRSWGALDDKNKQGQAKVLAQAGVLLKSGDTEGAKKIISEYAAAAESSGDAAAAATARAGAMLIDQDPDAALATIGGSLAVINPELARNVLGVGSAGNSLLSTKTVGGRVSVQTYRDGTTVVKDVATGEVLTGQEAQEAIQQAERADVEFETAKAGGRREGALQAEVDTGGQAAAAKAMGEEQVKFVTSALEGSSKVAASMSNIQDAINAIDAGAESGIIYNRLPNITKESASLQNSLDRMGLDVVGSVTFGALSEGELKLAMSTAAPRNLGPQELRAWLVEKLEAQRKVRAALIEQAQFLSNTDNNLQMWAERIGAPSGGSRPAAQQSVPQPSAQSVTEPEVQSDPLSRFGR